MRLRRIALALLLVVLAGFGWWRFGTRYTPSGQQPLITIDPAALAAMREDFNRAADGERVIVLLSPT